MNDSRLEAALKALRVISPDRLELLADWFDGEQRRRTNWMSRDVQNDLRQMAKLSRIAMKDQDEPF